MYEQKDIRIVPGSLDMRKGYGWEFELEPCEVLNKMADILRESNGNDPCYRYAADGGIDLTRWYEFHYGINKDSFVDTYITVRSVSVHDSDYTEEGLIFLTAEEQKQIKYFINECLLQNIGKGIRTLLVEAVKEGEKNDRA